MDAELDTFVTALYVTIDDALRMRPELRQWRPSIGLAPKLSDAELLTLAVLQALLGFTSETRFLRHAAVHLRAWFPYIPHQSGYNKRLRKAQGQLRAIIRLLAADTEHWDDDTWVMDSTPIECGRRARPRCAVTLPGGPPMATAPATRAGSGGCGSISCAPRPACRSPSRWPTPRSTSARWRGTSSKPNPRCCVPDSGSSPTRAIAPKSSSLLGPTRRRARPTRPQERSGPHTSPLLKPLRQLIESVNATLKTQLDLERHGGRTPGGVMTRVLQRLLALTAAIWHNVQSWPASVAIACRVRSRLTPWN